MMSREALYIRRIAVGAMAAALVCLLPGPAAEAPPFHDGGAPQSGATGVTVEPSPPISLSIQPADLQMMPGGAVARLVLEAYSSVPVERVSVEVRLPNRAIFADGSAQKSWNIDLTPGRPTQVPIELLIQGRGRLFVAAEMLGTVGDHSMRRGTAYELVVGPASPRSRVNDGAIQFQGRRTTRGAKR